MSLNKAMLIGNVGRDPEVRYIQSPTGNTKVATFTLATTERYRDRDGNLKEQTEWHNIVVWRGNADVVENYVRKGTQLYIEGRIRTRSWDDQSGNKRYTTEIVADSLQLLGKKADNPASQGQAPGQYGSPVQSGAQPQHQSPTGMPAQTTAGTQAAAPATPQYTSGMAPTGPTPMQSPSQYTNEMAPTGEGTDDDLPF